MKIFKLGFYPSRPVNDGASLDIRMSKVDLPSWQPFLM